MNLSEFYVLLNRIFNVLLFFFDIFHTQKKFFWLFITTKQIRNLRYMQNSWQTPKTMSFSDNQIYLMVFQLTINHSKHAQKN